MARNNRSASRRGAAVSPLSPTAPPRHGLAAPPGRPARLSLSMLGGIAALIAVAAVPRIWGAFSEFWLDEIWTLAAFGRNIHSAADIFAAHHDNNHYLVSLWLYLVHPQSDWIIYRLPSIVAGIGTVALAAAWARRWGGVAAVVAAVLSGGSFVLIFFSSEARGYALAGLFALAAVLAIDRFLETRSVASALAFAGASILGTLAHLTFVQVYLGMLAWSLVGSLRRARSGPTVAGWMLLLHALPAGFLAWLYWYDIRFLEFGGGDAYDLRQVLARAVSLAVGVDQSNGYFPLLAAVVVLGIALAGIILLVRAKDDVWIFFLAGLVVAPIVLLLARPPQVLHARYFYLNLLFFLLLASYLAERLWPYAAGRTAVAMTLTCFLLANGWLTVDFLRFGRGHFLDALRYIAANSPAGDINIAGDAEFSYRLYEEFYRPYVPGTPRFVIHKVVPNMPVPPEWIITNSQARRWFPRPAINDNVTGRKLFELVEVFPYAGLSGAQFAVYRRVKEPPPAAETSPADVPAPADAAYPGSRATSPPRDR